MPFKNYRARNKGLCCFVFPVVTSSQPCYPNDETLRKSLSNKVKFVK